MPSPARRALPFAVLGALAAWVLAGGGLACPVATFAHVPCPGCGMSRAVRALAHGHAADALRLHPVAPLAVLVLGWVALAAAWGSLRHDDPARYLSGRARRPTEAALVTLFTALFAVWIARGAGALGGPVPLSR